MNIPEILKRLNEIEKDETEATLPPKVFDNYIWLISTLRESLEKVEVIQKEADYWAHRAALNQAKADSVRGDLAIAVAAMRASSVPHVKCSCGICGALTKIKALGEEK